MKKVFTIIIMLIVTANIYSQDFVKQQLKKMGAVSGEVVTKPNKSVKSLYRFKKDGQSGAVIVSYIKELKTDVCITVIKVGKSYLIDSIYLLDEKSYNNKRLPEILNAFGQWDKATEKNIPDVISSATRHSQGLFKDIDKVIKSVIKDI
ncbi:hypothetical protein EW093_11765 [Thiospirochaeta perfilievii]|uniref:Uncharacterized protein n=1 Tax=Thiospirochaeta perfilievii TaxID=252967 RepID=A0A5C1QDD6_9SPIO|nr:hypothetical protein [Thiospirochaeta perfilievii]QEN05358.1 hypothetical protein EW093_11765 [Thiospirochaeta perfilievii]